MLLLGVPKAEAAADAASNSCLSAGMAPELTAGMPHALQMVAYRAKVPPAGTTAASISVYTAMLKIGDVGLLL